ncbi:FecR domain-containing protein [Sphingosinicella terrae]|uniref:FecR domain-containing protein n=1 Tax=Sphingosinicella terrae TaxID=2172047 RepID=UPI000E0E0914|nr:FecR domain-containing protein [Sphingosinicella terrae]
MRALILFLAALLAPLHFAAAAENDEMVAYTTKAGDNLYTLARRYFIRVHDYVEVQRLNRVANPYRLPTNRQLRIPRRLLRYEPLTARVAAFRGDVRVSRGGRVAPTAVGTVVGEGDSLLTGPNSFVTLRLADGSLVALPSQSRVLVRRLRRLLLTGEIEREFMLENGRARAVVTPMDETPGDFRVSTPVAISAVRGTEFRARYDADGRSGSTEVIEGEVGVSDPAGRASVSVTAGFGAVATPEGTGTVIPLLPPPALERPGRVQDGADLAFRVAPLQGAERYHVQVAQDAGFVDVVSETFSAGPEATLPGLPDGTWFVRISGLGPDGLEGMPATYSFRRLRLDIMTASERRRIGRYHEYLFRWAVEGAGTHRFRFQLMRGSPDSVPVIDEPGLALDGFVVTDLEPGTYFWRVMTIQRAEETLHAKWSAMQQLTISAEE